MFPSCCAWFTHTHTYSRITSMILDISVPICVDHHQRRTHRSVCSRRHVQRAFLHFITRWIPEQILQQSLNIDLITNGDCSDVSEELTHCVLHIWTIHSEQSVKHLFALSLIILIQSWVTLQVFLDNQMFEPLSSTKSKVCAQLFHVIPSNAEDEPTCRSAQGSCQELLTLLHHHVPTYFHLRRELLQQLSCRILYPLSACRPHNTDTEISHHINELTWVSLILSKILLLHLFREKLLSASRRYAYVWQCLSGPSTQSIPYPEDGFISVLQMTKRRVALRLVLQRCHQSLCVVSHERFVLFSLITRRLDNSILTPSLTWLRSKSHHFEILRSLALSTWLSTLWKSSWFPPGVQTWIAYLMVRKSICFFRARSLEDTFMSLWAWNDFQSLCRYEESWRASVGVLKLWQSPACHEFLSVQLLMHPSVQQRSCMFPTVCPLILQLLRWCCWRTFRCSSLLYYTMTFADSTPTLRMISSSVEYRFTPDSNDDPCCTSCSYLCRFASWSSVNPERAPSVPVSRNLFAIVTVVSCQELFQTRLLIYTLLNVIPCDTVCFHTSCIQVHSNQLLSSVSVSLARLFIHSPWWRCVPSECSVIIISSALAIKQRNHVCWNRNRLSSSSPRCTRIRFNKSVPSELDFPVSLSCDDVLIVRTPVSNWKTMRIKVSRSQSLRRAIKVKNGYTIKTWFPTSSQIPFDLASCHSWFWHFFHYDRSTEEFRYVCTVVNMDSSEADDNTWRRVSSLTDLTEILGYLAVMKSKNVSSSCSHWSLRGTTRQKYSSRAPLPINPVSVASLKVTLV